MDRPSSLFPLVFEIVLSQFREPSHILKLRTVTSVAAPFDSEPPMMVRAKTPPGVIKNFFAKVENMQGRVFVVRVVLDVAVLANAHGFIFQSFLTRVIQPLE